MTNDNVGNVVTVTAPNATLATAPACPATTTPNTTVYGYDNAHQQTSVTDPLGHLGGVEETGHRMGAHPLRTAAVGGGTSGPHASFQAVESGCGCGRHAGEATAQRLRAAMSPWEVVARTARAGVPSFLRLLLTRP